MQAFILTGTNGPASLQLTDVPMPTVGTNDVLIRVRAISINPVDYKTTRGSGVYGKISHDVAPIIGWDISGDVIQVGDKVSHFKPGDAVFGMVDFPGMGRAYAEYVAAPADQLAHKPAGISHENAVAATLAALTAWQTLITKANVQPGQRVLIHAAGGGVGHYAVQIAHEHGAYVIGTSSASKRYFVLSLDADEHVDYAQVRFEDTVEPVDVVLDSLGGENLERSLRVVKPGGTLISIVGIKPELVEQATANGVQAYAYLVSSNGVDQAAIAERLADGRIRSHVAETFSFAQLPDALRQVEGGKTQGKVIVTL